MDGITLARQDESRALTGLRGVGALLVMLHHFHQHLALDVHIPLLGGLLQKGYLGVDLFFVLSGFVMAMVYGPWFTQAKPGRGQAYCVFLLRRVARLWPLHAAIIGLVVAGWAYDRSHISTRWVAANLALIQGWGFSAEINPPAWSISTEMLAYLLFPLLAPTLLQWRWGAVLGLVAAAAAIAVCMHLAPPVGLMRRGPMDIYFNYSLLPVLRCLAGVLVGMTAWRLGQSGMIQRTTALPWLGPLALATVIALMLGRVNDLLIYPILPIVVLGMHHGRGPVWTAFAHGPLYRVGVLSYAIYLVHVILLSAFPFGWAPLGVELAVYLLEVAAAATLAHWLIERPGRHLVRAWGEAALARTWSRPLLQRGQG